MFKFIDKNKEPNLQYGIEYFAVGLVVESHIDYIDESSVVQKGYVVEYIDPWGNLNQAWRSVDEIEVSPVDNKDAEFLKMAFAQAALKNTE